MAISERFNSVEELYKRLLPAMNTKVTELKRKHIYVNAIDIWNYCVNNNWRNQKDLRIYKLVDNILNIDEMNLQSYLKKQQIKEW